MCLAGVPLRVCVRACTEGISTIFVFRSLGLLLWLATVAARARIAFAYLAIGCVSKHLRFRMTNLLNGIGLQACWKYRSMFAGWLRGGCSLYKYIDKDWNDARREMT